MKKLMMLSGALAAFAVCAETALPTWQVTWTNEAATVGLASNDKNDLVLNVVRSSATATNLTVG